MIKTDLTVLNEHDLEIIEELNKFINSENVDDVLDCIDVDNINVIPNVSLATVILNKHNENVVLKSDKWYVTYDISNKSYEELDEHGLYPYFGYAVTYSKFFEINEIC